MLKFIIALIYTAAFSTAVFAQYEYENKGALTKSSGGTKANSDAETGEEMQNRILNYEKGDPGAASATRIQRKEVGAPNPEEYETPGDALARFNNMKRSGAGAFKHEPTAAVNCTPQTIKGRNPANAGEINGYRCTKVLPGSGFAKAGILDGDIVKSIDGKKLDSMVTGPSHLRKIENAEYSQIVIVRDGREAILAPPLR
jgi:hypothetical protein